MAKRKGNSGKLWAVSNGETIYIFDKPVKAKMTREAWDGTELRVKRTDGAWYDIDGEIHATKEAALRASGDDGFWLNEVDWEGPYDSSIMNFCAHGYAEQTGTKLRKGKVYSFTAPTMKLVETPARAGRRGRRR